MGSDTIMRLYGRYTKFMRKRGMKPASQKNFLKQQDNLHSMHFGTFSPVKPLKGQTDFSRHGGQR